ncbi:hypothetical protein [Humidesulfovibrio sp.]
MLRGDRKVTLELQRKAQQGLGRPIISWVDGKVRYVAVGGSVLFSQSWGTFHDFLKDYVVEVFEKSWFEDELAQPEPYIHPLVQWYCGICEAYRRLSPTGRRFIAADANGLLTAFLCFSYNLYLVSHNVELLRKFVMRLKDKKQFYGAYYELFVAAQFIKSGFSIEFEDESACNVSHVEFTATNERSGKMYSVEAKARHSSNELGLSCDVDPKLCAKIRRKLLAALQKEASYERVVFIDANFPDKASDPNNKQILKDLSFKLRDIENDVDIKGKPAPPAYVFITNYPYHYELHGLDYHCSAIAVGFRIQDFNIDSRFSSLSEALISRDKHREMLDLMDCMRNQEVPSTFNGEIPEFTFGESELPRLMIGKKYLIPGQDGKEYIGELMSACVVESEQLAFGSYLLDNGHYVTASCPLSDLEMRAYRRHPDTFFDVVSPAGRRIKDGIDLFDFFFETYKDVDKDKLLGFMASWPDFEVLQGMSQDKLAQIFCTRLAESESSKL